MLEYTQTNLFLRSFPPLQLKSCQAGPNFFWRCKVCITSITNMFQNGLPDVIAFRRCLSVIERTIIAVLQHRWWSVWCEIGHVILHHIKDPYLRKWCWLDDGSLSPKIVHPIGPFPWSWPKPRQAGPIVFWSDLEKHQGFQICFQKILPVKTPLSRLSTRISVLQRSMLSSTLAAHHLNVILVTWN